MPTRYHVTVNQAKVLRTFSQSNELSAREIAVYAQLLPNDVGEAVAALERMGLVTSWFAGTGRTSEQLVALSGDGRAVTRALAQYQGTPPVGAVVPIPTGTSFSGWFSSGPITGSGTPHVLVGPDKK